MTLNQFRDALRQVAPELLRCDQSDGLEIYITDGYCQVIIDDPEQQVKLLWTEYPFQGKRVIGAADENDEGGWESALDKAIEWLKKEREQ